MNILYCNYLLIFDKFMNEQNYFTFFKKMKGLPAPGLCHSNIDVFFPCRHIDSWVFFDICQQKIQNSLVPFKIGNAPFSFHHFHQRRKKICNKIYTICVHFLFISSSTVVLSRSFLFARIKLDLEF